MTSLDVTGTDAFLDMPASSQLLYFHLNSKADDDGFVANPKSIMRNCGSQADDLKLLVAKKFVIAFEDGVCVIKHWRINNFIRKDIYKETKYLDLKNILFIRPNGAYTLNDDGRAVPVPKGHFNLEDVDVTLTNSQPRLGKDSIGKDRLGEREKYTPSEEAKNFFEGNIEDMYQEFHSKLSLNEEILKNEFKKFILYWTEKNKSGTKQRWEQQNTFEVKRRLATWLEKMKDFKIAENKKDYKVAF